MAPLTDLADLDFQPQPGSAEPIYVQLAGALSDAIRAGRIAVGTRLPSERIYATLLGLSRTTITSAYQQLKTMGLLRGYVGRGAIVIANDPDATPGGAVSWPQLASSVARLRMSTRNAGYPQAISFADGWLHPSLVPAAALEAGAARILKDRGLLTSAAPLLGLPALQQALIDLLRGNAIKATPGELLITGGAQQGLEYRRPGADLTWRRGAVREPDLARCAARVSRRGCAGDGPVDGP